jgi:hypothetical protein
MKFCKLCARLENIIQTIVHIPYQSLNGLICYHSLHAIFSNLSSKRLAGQESRTKGS